MHQRVSVHKAGTGADHRLHFFSIGIAIQVPAVQLRLGGVAPPAVDPLGEQSLIRLLPIERSRFPVKGIVKGAVVAWI